MSDSQGKTKNTVKGNLNTYSNSSMSNAIDSVIDNALASKVMTAEVVKVISVTPGGPMQPSGYVDCAPMVNQTDSFGDAIPGTNLYHLPYMRVQGGKVALVIDPEPGDIGLVVFTKADSSNVTQGAEGPVQPASLRTFDEGNGFYVSAFLNKAPETYIELNKNFEINIKAKSDITIETEGDLKIKAANINITGGVTADDITGKTITGNGVVLDTHTHNETNGATTLGPN
jgi:hypothetical protein